MTCTFPPKLWSQSFMMLCFVVEGWHDCVINNKRLVYVTRETLRTLGISEAAISDFMYRLRENDVAEPADPKSHDLRNCLVPISSGLLNVRNYFEAEIKKLKKSDKSNSVCEREILRLEELKNHAEKIYSSLFGNPRK